MALRTFTDEVGVEWRVWDCTSDLPGLLGGFLCFESSAEKRRLCPIPSDWETCPPERLDVLSRVAPRVQARAAYAA